MKKLLLLSLIFPCIAVSANEITEDYLDIATNYCIYGKYSDANVYLDRILQIEPNNSDVKELKNTISRVTNSNTKSYLSASDKTIQQAVSYKKQGNLQKQLSTLSSDSRQFLVLLFLAEYYRKTMI